MLQLYSEEKERNGLQNSVPCKAMETTFTHCPLDNTHQWVPLG